MLDFSLYGGAESLADGRPPLNRSHRSRSPCRRRTRRTVVQRPRPQPSDDLQPPQDPNDFLWLMTEEPHRSRRMEILKTHPEVRNIEPRRRQ
jgi:sphingolipid delta-4 desaturase